MEISSKSDSVVPGYLYQKMGDTNEIWNLLDGIFACVIYDGRYVLVVVGMFEYMVVVVVIASKPPCTITYIHMFHTSDTSPVMYNISKHHLIYTHTT